MQRSPPPDDQKESPDLVVQDGASGIEDLPRRVNRYGQAKKQSLEVSDFIDSLGVVHRPVRDQLRECGNYLVFRHYFTIDEVRLHGARLCKKHLLCPLCAIRRGSKALAAYVERWEVIRAEKPRLRPFLVTLTVKDGPDLAERFQHLHKSQRELWKRKHRGRGSALDHVEGAVWSYEVKRGSGSGVWHPHLHMIALAESQPDVGALSREWHEITGDSFVVDVRPIEQADPVSGFFEVFKYAVKFSDQPPADTWHCFQTLKGKRLLDSAGCFRGVEVPEQLTDDELHDLPYRTLFYRYLRGGYSLDESPPVGDGGAAPGVGRRMPSGPCPERALSPRPHNVWAVPERSQQPPSG